MSTDRSYGFRVALAFGDTMVKEIEIPLGRKVTVGHADSNTFVLPCGTLGKRILVKGDVLQLLDAFDGQVNVSGAAQGVSALRDAGHTSVRLAPEDWAMLSLIQQPSVRLVIQRVQPEPAPKLPRREADVPYMMTTMVAFVAFILFMLVSFLRYDPDRPELTLEELDERFTRVMWNYPPPEEEEEEAKPEVSDKDQKEEKARKRAGGKEGKFGDPRKRGPSNIPKNADEELAKDIRVGLVKELDTLARTDTMANLLTVGSKIGGLDEGEFIVGGGNYGMSTKGSGQGGGGIGEGTIHGTGDVDVGGRGVANRKRTVKGSGKPKEKKVKVRTGPSRIKGQLSKELIDREVRRHRSQISFCYNKQLTRFPNLKGKVTLTWVIAMDGSVKRPRVRSSSLGNRDTESCMVRALGNWRFPKPNGGIVEVQSYPFIFGST